MSDDNNDKSAVDHAVDLLVYAPIGLFFEAPALVPKLAEQGRLHARNARLFGQFAVRQGEAEIRRRTSALEEQAAGLLRVLGVVPEPEVPAPPPAAPAPEVVVVEAPVADDGPAAADLAIPDYDSLSAVQVVSRLPGLTPADLDGVRAYELAHRGRKTILNKVAQLQA